MKFALHLYKILFLFAFIGKAQTPSFLWAKTFGGTSDEYVYSTAIDAAGNVYSVGYFDGTTDLDPSATNYSVVSQGGHDIFISKIDASGNFLWAKTIGGIGDDVANAIALDLTGNIYVTGNFSSVVDFDTGAGTYTLSSQGGGDVFILKLDASGNFLWAGALGDVTFDTGSSIKIDNNNDILVTGYFAGTVDLNIGAGTMTVTSANLTVDIFLLKLTSTGNFMWGKVIGGTDVEGTSSLALDATGNIYCTGQFSGICDFDPSGSTFTLNAGSNSDAFIFKLDVIGNLVWAKQFTGTSFDSGNDICLDNNGNIYTTGSFMGTTDFDPGPSSFTYAATNDRTFISKLDGSGNFVWAKVIGGNKNAGSCIATDASNNVFIAGTFWFTADFDPGVATYSVASLAFDDFYLLKLDPLGNFIWAGTMGGTDGGFIGEIAFDPTGNIYAVGTLGGTIDFDPNGGIYNLTANGGGDGFIQKLSPNPAGLENIVSDNNKIIIYPNPTSDKIFAEGEINKISITNSLGQLVFETESNNTKQEIDLRSLSLGVYFLKVSTENSQKVFKILKD